MLLSNHLSLADYFILAQLGRQCPGGSTQVNFFSWYSLFRVPSIKTLYNMVKCDENWELEKQLCDPVFHRVLNSSESEWVALFPEVNIWTPHASFMQNAQSKKFYLPVLSNTLYPRFSGLSNIVTGLRGRANNKFTTLYDITINYGDRKGPTLLQLFSSQKAITAYIHVREIQFSQVLTKRPKLERWLEKCWVEKDKELTASIKHRESEKLLAPLKEISEISILDVPLSSLAV